MAPEKHEEKDMVLKVGISRQSQLRPEDPAIVKRRE